MKTASQNNKTGKFVYLLRYKFLCFFRSNVNELNSSCWHQRGYLKWFRNDVINNVTFWVSFKWIFFGAFLTFMEAFLYLAQKLEFFVRRTRNWRRKCQQSKIIGCILLIRWLGYRRKRESAKMLIPKVHLPSYSFCINYKSCSRHLVLLVGIFLINSTVEIHFVMLKSFVTFCER